MLLELLRCLLKRCPDCGKPASVVDPVRGLLVCPDCWKRIEADHDADLVDPGASLHTQENCAICASREWEAPCGCGLVRGMECPFHKENPETGEGR